MCFDGWKEVRKSGRAIDAVRREAAEAAAREAARSTGRNISDEMRVNRGW